MAETLGLRHKLNVFHGRGHALHLDENRNINGDFYLIQNDIRDFFYDDIVDSKVLIREVTDDSCFDLDMTDVIAVKWNVEGGFITENDDGDVTVSWFSDDDEHKIEAAGCYVTGAAFYDSIIIKND